MTPNPILKVLSTFKKHRVKSLLIGGQACIIYGAAEFSRDSDFVILSSSKNLEMLRKALKSLKAELVYFPPLEADYLERGHACHFRCLAGEVKGLRVDVISKLRGCDLFDILWKRRKIVSLKNNIRIDVIGLQDLVRSKKTQRDKDWLMLKRLVENDIIQNKSDASIERIRWWLMECRNAQRLIEFAREYPKLAKECLTDRPLLSLAITENVRKLDVRISEEEAAERQRDIAYWEPLKKELETLRHRG